MNRQDAIAKWGAMIGEDFLSHSRIFDVTLIRINRVTVTVKHRGSHSIDKVSFSTFRSYYPVAQWRHCFVSAVLAQHAVTSEYAHELADRMIGGGL